MVYIFKDSPDGKMFVNKKLTTNCSKSPPFDVVTLSDIELGSKLLTKVTTPLDAIP